MINMVIYQVSYYDEDMNIRTLEFVDELSALKSWNLLSTCSVMAGGIVRKVV